MKPLVWPLLAVLAGLAMACDDEYALYRSPKYVPGYTPRGDSSLPALARAQAYEREHNLDWRER
jgi:hypothetical protein